MDYESTLLVKNEVFVYQLPPRQSNRGYRATDWGLDSPFWTGRLKVVSKGRELTIKLEDRNTGELFAKCPIDEFPGIAIETVLDSSRYFVIRLKNDDGRTMFMGMGFAERSDSFDLNVAIQDHFKLVGHALTFEFSIMLIILLLYLLVIHSELRLIWIGNRVNGDISGALATTFVTLMKPLKAVV